MGIISNILQRENDLAGEVPVLTPHGLHRCDSRKFCWSEGNYG